MTEDHRTPFRDAQIDRRSARHVPLTEQTQNPSYRLAFADDDFLCRDELRPVRLQLELLKPQLMLDEHHIESTVVLFGGAVIASLFAVQQELNVFRSPTEIVEQGFETGKRFRIGGLVEEGTVHEEGLLTEFRVTDMSNSVSVSYTGIKPNMFREGQGVVAEGRLNPKGVFIADEVLAKHDEKYMPKEVADALKEQGEWRPDDTLIDDSVTEEAPY